MNIIHFRCLSAVAASILYLGFFLSLTQIEAAWLKHGSKCENETLALYNMNDFKLDDAASNYSYLALHSIAENITGAILNKKPTVNITTDLSDFYSDATFITYRDACFSVDGMICFFDLNAHANITLSSYGVEIVATIYGFPFCAAPSCTREDIVNTTNQDLSGPIAEKIGAPMNFSLDVTKVNCHTLKC